MLKVTPLMTLVRKSDEPCLVPLRPSIFAVKLFLF
jgi:hypothetical protein